MCEAAFLKEATLTRTQKDKFNQKTKFRKKMKNTLDFCCICEKTYENRIYNRHLKPNEQVLKTGTKTKYNKKHLTQKKSCDCQLNNI